MNYYIDIKNKLIDNEINKKIKDYSKNKSDLDTYYNVGKLLSEAGKHYGEGIIKEYSRKLQKDLNKTYSTRGLYKMIKYYKFMSNNNLPTVSAILTWSHYDELLKLDDVNKIIYYINVCENQNLSIRKLRNKIKSNEYERLPKDAKNKLIKHEKEEIKDLIKDPILIKSNSNYESISEKILQKLILENIELFMKELGNSFSFIGSEYKIKIGNSYNYIDLLLFNYKFNCFVKATELKKEHIGQIEIYMNYVDKNLKENNQDKTIGIIICKRNNKYIIEYCSDKRIIAKEYKLV